MGFPTYQRMAVQVIGPGTSHNVSIDFADIVAGDGLLIIGRHNTGTGLGTVTGWTGKGVGAQGTAQAFAFAKVADGSEDGTTVDVPTTNSSTIRVWVYRILKDTWRGNLSDIEGIGGNSASGQDPDPPSLTASWGADDNAWICSAGVQTAAGTTVSYPAGYSNGDNSAFTAFVADRNNNTATENPGVFDIDGANAGYHSITVVIRGKTVGTAALVLNNVSVAASGSQKQIGSAALALNNVTITAVGNMKPVGTSALILPDVDMASSGLQKQIASSVIVLPDLDMAAAGTAPGATTGTSVIVLPDVDMASSGLQRISGTSALELPAVVVAASALQVFEGVSTLALRAVTLQASGSQRVIATANIVLPSVLLSADGLQRVLGSSVLVLPSVQLLAAAAVALPPGKPVSVILELFPYLASIEVGEYTLLVDIRKVLPGIITRSL